MWPVTGALEDGPTIRWVGLEGMQQPPLPLQQAREPMATMPRGRGVPAVGAAQAALALILLASALGATEALGDSTVVRAVAVVRASREATVAAVVQARRASLSSS